MPSDDRNERSKALDVAVSQIEKQFGKGSIMRLGQKGAIAPVDFIPTGAISLDFALGIGGVPRGRVVEIFGPESSGKTTLTLHLIAEAQKAGGYAAFIDAEHALDPGYARALGVRKAARVIGGRLASDNARLHCPLRDSGAAASSQRSALQPTWRATMNIYQHGLDRCAANHAQLSPVSFVERSAEGILDGAVDAGGGVVAHHDGRLGRVGPCGTAVDRPHAADNRLRPCYHLAPHQLGGSVPGLNTIASLLSRITLKRVCCRRSSRMKSPPSSPCLAEQTAAGISRLTAQGIVPERNRWSGSQ